MVFFFLIGNHSGFTIVRIFFGFIASIACKDSTVHLIYAFLCWSACAVCNFGAT